MTAKDTTDRTGKAIDFTMMYVTHDAFYSAAASMLALLTIRRRPRAS
jgi:hypothetical protein